MEKTSTFIEVVPVGNTTYPQTTIVRAPTYLKVFRCTVIWQAIKGTNGYLSTISEQNELNRITFSNYNLTATQPPPNTDQTDLQGVQTFIFDRLGVGYMVENFYVSGDGSLRTGANFIFVWEGVIQST